MCATGIQFWPLDPRPEEIDLRDIARALSMQCRWGGHVNEFYSVAQHCVSVSHHCEGHALEGLLHDAAEAYLVDVPTPIKRNLNVYYKIEEKLLEVIGEKFGVNLVDLPEEVKAQDAAALATEHRDIRTPLDYWVSPAPPWPETIKGWDPRRAELNFIRCARICGLL